MEPHPRSSFRRSLTTGLNRGRSASVTSNLSRGGAAKNLSRKGVTTTVNTPLLLQPDEEYMAGTMLLRDCAMGDVGKVRSRIQAQPNLLDFKDYDHRTPLHVSASEGHEKIVRMLLEMGADANQSDRWGGSPYDDAQRSGVPEIAALLQEHGGRGGVMDRTIELALACSRGSLERAEHIIEQGASVNCRDYDHRTPLHIAAAAGHPEVCRTLLRLGADVNSENRWGRTPLDEAVHKGHKECAEILNAHGGRSNHTGDSSQTPPTASARSRSADITTAGTNLSVNGKSFLRAVGAGNWSISGKNLLPAVNKVPPATSAMGTMDFDHASLEVDWADVQIIDKIGTGGFGDIFKCRWRGTIVAAKRMKAKATTPEQHMEAVADFKKEIEILMNLRHPNICLLLGYSLTDKHEVMLSELMKCSLQDVMKASAGAALSLERTMRYAIQFARGMAYLHTCKPPILHRDLKPANLLLDFADNLKVADFGLARLRNPRSDSSAPSTYVPYVMTGETGSYRYMAPEVFRHEKYGRPVDVYSFSLILHFMLVGEEPWANTEGATAVELAATKMDRPAIPRHVASRLRNLLVICWDDVPSNRPSFSAVLEQLEEFHCRQFNLTFEEKMLLREKPEASCECTIS